LSEKEQFEKASAYELAADRVPALEKFLAAFPESENRPAAVDLLISSRLLIAEEKLLSGDGNGALAIFRQVVEQMPQPVPNDLFTESIAKIPSTLFFRGMRVPALELATLIETKVDGNPAQLLEIANFHLATENAGEAMRVAAKAAAKDPSSAAVHRTIALAHRMNFDLDLSADSYAKSLELEPDSAASKRSLAEMKRALGKSDEAVALYRELLATNEGDLQSRTGLILALFDSGNQTAAEAEMNDVLAKTPGNVVLLGGAAYWYAAKGQGAKAVEYAEKAIAREPRYIWSHIALARGLMSQNKPVEAEQVLVKARAFGNFPTLEYELASARIAAGFFREAVEDLQKQFAVTSSGNIKTNLGGRVSREEKGLADLAGFERKASIFTPIAADTTETAETLKALLVLDQKLQATQPDESEVAAAVDAFTSGSDKMKLHRQMYAASLLLQKHIAVAKALELAKAATGKTDAALEVANPRAAVMASELYEARATAFRRNEFLLVPEVPPQTLSAILRGRIEEIAGWALYQQNNFPEAIIRLRRSISVMPGKSAWWRSSMWRLGAALAADGKEAEALTSYIESYKTDKPDYAKYAVVEALYKKLNGTTDGLEAMIGRDRVALTPTIQEIKPSAVVPNTDAPSTVPSSTPAAESVVPATVVSEPATDQKEISPAKTEETPSSETAVPDKPHELKTEVPVKPEPTGNDPPAKAVETSPAVNTEEPKKEIETRVPEKIPEKAPEKIAEPDLPAPQQINSEGRNKKEPANEKPAADPKTSQSKSLFDPIIITIPKSRPVKLSTDSAKNEANSSGDPDKKSGEASNSSGTERERVIDGSEPVRPDVSPCMVDVSQENVSLINSGGSVGILVSVEAPGNIKSLRAISASPKDVELTLEPEIGGISDRRFFVIKSVSTKVGVYQVTFAADCGKKEVIVTVR
jgi:tetratricopeptide (TPR) repeat protein